MRSKTPAQRVARMGLLFALALILSLLEGWVTPMLGLPPGVKLGLANTVVLYAILFLGKWQALTLVLLKAAFALFARGIMAGALSLCGGVLSFAVILLLLLPKKKIAILLLSVAGAVAHNMGQMLVVWLWLGTFSLIYAPVLVLSGVAMGCLVALITKAILPTLQNVVPQTDTKSGRKQDKST